MKLYLKHLIALAAICILLLLISSIGLKIYTRHNRTYPVPDLYGMSIEEASAVLHAGKLRIEINDSMYNNSMPPSVVLIQNPAAGTMVKNNRRIFLIINASQPEQVEAPYVVGVSFRQAKSILEERGLAVGDTTYVPDIARNNVLEQKFNGKPLASGVKLNKGARVDLVLGLGDNPVSSFSDSEFEIME